MENRVYRPVAEIVQQFLQELEAHPDAQIASCSIAGPCPGNLLLPNTPRNVQHFSELRLVYRDPVETPEEKANKPWKWQGVIDELNKPPVQEPTPPPNKKWAHLLPPTKQQLEEQELMRQLEEESKEPVGAV